MVSKSKSIETDAAQKLLHNASGQLVRQSVVATAHQATGGVTSYGYDSKGQIAGETSTRGLGHNHSFGFDGAGNPTSWRGTARTFNANNQETTGGPLAFSYDGAGNATRWSGKRMVSTPSPTQGAPNLVSEEANGLAMSYSAQGQMAQVNALESDGSAGVLKQKNGYRGDGLRAWKEDANGHRTYFFYAGTTLTAMVSEDTSGTLSPPRQLLWGADGLLGTRWREANGDEKASYFLWDTQGNLALSYDQTGQLSRSFGFTAYGSPLPDANGELAEATFGYGGKFGYFRDGETGLVLCTWRFYDSSLGTWTQRDPIGYAGGANLYAYVEGDPANFVDPLGLYYWRNGPSVFDMGISGSRPSQKPASPTWEDVLLERGTDLIFMSLEGLTSGSPAKAGKLPCPPKSHARSKNKAPTSGQSPKSVLKNNRPDGSRSETYYNDYGQQAYRRDYGQKAPHRTVPAGAPHEHRYRYNDKGQPIGQDYRELYRGQPGKQHGPWIPEK